MIHGLMKRYQQAGVDPPAVLYVDCGCCVELGETKLKSRFSDWPDLLVRLDIWHFMRRIALGCTTDAHQLYPIFMSRVSACIFEWDAADLSVLREAKRSLLMSQGWPSPTDEDVNKQLTREELALHCRRRTRGKETTILLLEQLFTELLSSRGNDSMGVPLLDRERMEHNWRIQKKHVDCIQDPPGVVLYTETGSLSKGGVLLKTYRCARGSTSLESFHLHLNRFIPGRSLSHTMCIYTERALHVIVCFFNTPQNSVVSIYRDQCEQSELSDLSAGGITSVEPGQGGCFFISGTICFTQLLRRTCSLCEQEL